MKYLIFVSVILLSFGSFSQQEKGLTIKDRFSFSYEDGSNYNVFSDIWPFSPYYGSLDTFKIAISQSSNIKIEWHYLNELEMSGHMYDTVQWFYNDSLLNEQSYTIEINDSYSYSASSSINEVKIGYYQLRNLGEGNKMYSTNYPVIHVYEKKKDSTILKSSTEINLYPNPTSNIIKLKLSQSIKNGEMNVYSLKGELELSYPLIDVALNSKYDISKLSSGIYIFSIIDNENGGEIKRMKVVIE